MIGYIWTRESNLYDKEKYSIKSQLDACREAAEADGVEVAREFQVQFSGRDLWAIPELTELRAIVQREQGPKRVYCYSQDRLVRGEEGPEIFWLLFELRRSAAEVVILKNPIDLKSIAGQIMTLVAGHEAAGEITKIRDRTMRGKRKRVQEGKLWGQGRDKYGYKRDKEQGIAEISEAEAEVVKRLYREVTAGKGLLTLAKDLNRAGIPTSFTARGERKAQWHPATIRALLRDPAYKGEVWAYRYGATEPLRMPDNLFPAIVDSAVWDRAQERLEANRGEQKRNCTRPALLRGLIFCRACGARMYHTTQHGYFYYRCSGGYLRSHQNGATRCAGPSSRADWIESEVWKRFVWLVNNPDELIAALDLARTVGIADQLEARLNVVRRQIEAKGGEQVRLARRLRQANGRVAALVEAEIHTIEAERANLQAEAAGIEAELGDQRSWRVRVEQVYEVCHRLAATAGSAAFEQKRASLEEWRIIVLASGGEWAMASAAFVSTSKSVLNRTYTELAKSR